MTSFVSLLLVLAALPAAPVSDGFAARVAREVATEWGVSESSVRLTWGRGTGLTPGDATPFRIAGRSSDGWLALVLGDPNSTSALRVRAGVDDSTWVAAHAVPAAHVLTPSDVESARSVRWGGPARRGGTQPVVGWQTRRPLSRGDLVTWPAAAPPALVVAGAPVRLEWSRGAVSIVLQGVAANSARLGESVRARVPGRAAPVFAFASAPGVAALTSGGTR